MQAKQCKACGAAYLGDHCVCTRVVKIDAAASGVRCPLIACGALPGEPCRDLGVGQTPHLARVHAAAGWLTGGEVCKARAELRSTSDLVDRLIARFS